MLNNGSKDIKEKVSIERKDIMHNDTCAFWEGTLNGCLCSEIGKKKFLRKHSKKKGHSKKKVMFKRIQGSFFYMFLCFSFMFEYIFAHAPKKKKKLKKKDET